MSESYYPAHASRPVVELPLPNPGFTISGATHVKPGGGWCSYMADHYCNKCGWIETSNFSGAAQADLRKISHRRTLGG